MTPGICSLTILLVVSAAHAGNWPGCEVPAFGYTDEKDLPLHWDGKTKENLLWKVPLGGIGNSSPIVWGDWVFVTVTWTSTAARASGRL